MQRPKENSSWYKIQIDQLPPSDTVRKQEKYYFRGSFEFSNVNIKKNPLET